MDKNTGMQDDGTESLPYGFAEAVDRFCHEQAKLRSRLARIGGEVNVFAPTLARGCDRHVTPRGAS